MSNDEHNIVDILCDSLESLSLDNINSFRNTTSSKKRALCQYDVNDLKRIQCQKEILQQEIQISELDGLKIYPNQQSAAQKTVETFLDRQVTCVLTIAHTQSGKTGYLTSFINQFLQYNTINVNHIFIITGHSSKEWVKQTKTRVPRCLEKQVYHRNSLEKFTKDISGKTNCLVLIDEVHVASNSKQSICHALEKSNLLSLDELLCRDIKFVEVSATPDAVFSDCSSWGKYSRIQLMDPGVNYTSCIDLMNQGRVFSSRKLCDTSKKKLIKKKETIKNIENAFLEIKNVLSRFDSPLYHLIRVPVGSHHQKVINNFQKYFDDVDYDIIKYNKKTKIVLNELLSKKPKKHTFIILKEMLRCAVTVEKKYLGILYERNSKTPIDSTIIQGLLGRATGYNIPRQLVVFTNIHSISKYKSLWESKFTNISSIDWKYRNKKKNKDIETFQHPRLYGMRSDSNDKKNQKDREPTIKRFNTQKEVKEFYKKVLKPKLDARYPNKRELDKHKKYGPRIRKPNKEGKYVNYIRKKRCVLSCNEVYEIRSYGLDDKNYRLYPCYEDVTKPSTLQFWLIYYEPK
jgi:hypothetical protein